MAQAPTGGLLNSLRRLAATVVAIVGTRLELLANEVEEEALRLAHMLVLTVVALICFAFAALLLSALLLVVFWDDHPAGVLAGLAALYAFAGLVSIALLKRKKSQSKLFATTLRELARDREHLSSRP